MSKNRGFSLVELIAVMVIAGILAAVTLGNRVSGTSLQLQASRDSLVAALHSAQQLAMNRAHDTALRVGSTVDLLMDTDNDGVFDDESSVVFGGVRYPISLPNGISLNEDCGGQLRFNRLGQTGGCTLTLNKAGQSIQTQVYPSGFAR